MYAAYLSASAERQALAERSAVAGSQTPAVSQHSEEQMQHHYLDAYQAVGFIFVASFMLIVLFFFMKYLIYIIILLFCYGAAGVSCSHNTVEFR